MKKLLITILSIFGICFSFCSAESWNILNYYPNVSSTNNSYKYRDANNTTTGFTFSVESVPIILKSFCYAGSPKTFNSDNPYLIYSFDNWATSSRSTNFVDSGSFGRCADFGTGIEINVGDIMNYKFQGTSIPCFNCDLFRPVNIDGVSQFGYFYIGNFGCEIISYGGTSYMGPKYIVYDNLILPSIFKVNYGNTSYEYELEDNLFIHLKSPTIQNGNTFSYAGSTGINLFYNGISQFYSKSNLYLESMYWFNNNIFTPICL